MREMMHEAGKEGMVCKCPHHKFIPLLVILFALAFLLKAYGVLSEGMVDVVWPILVGLVGVLKLTESKCKCGPMGRH